jgi:hypothetical protein
MRILLLFCCVWVLGACNPTDAPPPNLLTEAQMVEFLADLHLSEQRVAELRLQSQDSSLAVFRRVEQDLFRRHRIDTAAYRQSYQYYAARPERFKLIYQAVVDSLTKRDERLKKSANSRPTAADSAQRAR